MKTMKKSIFALCLLVSGAAIGQTTSGSTYNSGTTSTTTSTSNSNSPTYNSNTTTPTGTMSTTVGSMDMNTGTTNNPAGNTGTTTGTGAINNAPMNTSDNTTTTTTTTSSDYNSNNAGKMNRNNRDSDGTREWGKSGKFGIYAGLNASRFVNEPTPDDAYRLGWQAGIYGRSGGTIFGQIGLEYRNSTANLIRVNNSSTAGSVNDQTKGSLKQQFLAIPAYVGIRIGSALGLRLQVGAELSSQVAIGKNNFKLGNDDVRRTLVNGLLGAGINLGPLTLDAVYNHGLSNVFERLDTRRNTGQINLGFRF